MHPNLRPSQNPAIMNKEKPLHIFAVQLMDFETKVIAASKEKLILVDFWADWCPPCLTIGPILEKLTHEFDGRFALAKIEVDEGENMKLAGRYQVRGFPTILFVRDCNEVARFSGAKPAHFIRELIEDHLD
jgi:putative thioredoxin